jgi:hypothetical protein
LKLSSKQNLFVAFHFKEPFFGFKKHEIFF